MAQITRFGTSGTFITLEIALEVVESKMTKPVQVCGFSRKAELFDQETGDSWEPVAVGGDVALCHFLPPFGKSGTWMRFKVPNPDKRMFSLKSALFNTPVENLVLEKSS